MPNSPPPILAIESATRVLSVALLRGEELVAEVVGEARASAAQTLLSAIDEVLRRGELPIEEMEGYAVSIGPGSFTGLRVGLATVKGLAFDPPRPLAPVSTLAALAAGAGSQPEPVAALLDARRGEVYAAVFPGHSAEVGPALLPEGLFRPEELAERLPIPCCLVGDGVSVAGPLLLERWGDRVRLLPESLGVPRAFHVGQLGFRLLASKRGMSADRVFPRYLRRAEAEARRTGCLVESDSGAGTL